MSSHKIDKVESWILEYHTNKYAVESLLHFEGHDDSTKLTKELLKTARFYFVYLKINYSVSYRLKWQNLTGLVLLAELVISKIPPVSKISTMDKFKLFQKHYQEVLVLRINL